MTYKDSFTTPEDQQKALLDAGICEWSPTEPGGADLELIPGAVSVETKRLVVTDFGLEVVRYQDDLNAERLQRLDAAMLRVAALLDELGVEILRTEDYDYNHRPDGHEYRSGYHDYLVAKLREGDYQYDYDLAMGTRL